MKDWLYVQIIKNLCDSKNQENIGDILQIALLFELLIINPLARYKFEDYLNQI